jgi:hypothetical protein
LADSIDISSVPKIALLASCLVLILLGCDSAKPPSNRVRVPNVVGLEEKAALRRIRRANFCVPGHLVRRAPLKADLVVEQWPKLPAGPCATKRAIRSLAGATCYPSSQSFGDCPPTHYVVPLFEG